MSDSTYHMTKYFFEVTFFVRKGLDFVIMFSMLLWTSLCNVTKCVNHYWFNDFITWRNITLRHGIM